MTEGPFWEGSSNRITDGAWGKISANVLSKVNFNYIRPYWAFKLETMSVHFSPTVQRYLFVGSGYFGYIVVAVIQFFALPYSNGDSKNNSNNKRKKEERKNQNKWNNNIWINPRATTFIKTQLSIIRRTTTIKTNTYLQWTYVRNSSKKQVSFKQVASSHRVYPYFLGTLGVGVVCCCCVMYFMEEQQEKHHHLPVMWMKIFVRIFLGWLICIVVKRGETQSTNKHSHRQTTATRTRWFLQKNKQTNNKKNNNGGHKETQRRRHHQCRWCGSK